MAFVIFCSSQNIKVKSVLNREDEVRTLAYFTHYFVNAFQDIIFSLCYDSQTIVFQTMGCSSSFQTHRMFLHSLYQRMITGQVYVSSPDSALSKYSWTDMCNLVSEQVSAHLSELNRATERV